MLGGVEGARRLRCCHALCEPTCVAYLNVCVRIYLHVVLLYCNAPATQALRACMWGTGPLKAHLPSCASEGSALQALLDVYSQCVVAWT